MTPFVAKLAIGLPTALLAGGLSAFFGVLAPIVEWGLFSGVSHPSAESSTIAAVLGALSAWLYTQLIWQDHERGKLRLNRATNHGALCGILVTGLLHAILIAGSGTYAMIVPVLILVIPLFGGLGGAILGAICFNFVSVVIPRVTPAPQEPVLQ